MNSEWSDDELLLGDARIDDSHRAFFDKLNEALAATGEEFARLFYELHDHLMQHFEEEDALMDACSFPSSKEHKGEHRRVLGEMSQFRRQVERGRLKMAQAYLADNLPSWFRLHLTTMDGALVAHLAEN
jgi:hemerythrin